MRRTIPSFTALGFCGGRRVFVSTIIMALFFILGAVFLNRTPLGPQHHSHRRKP
jgi:hypothetical protein